MTTSRSARFSAQEKTLLGLVAGAGIVVWVVLIAALAIGQNHPASAQAIVPSTTTLNSPATTLPARPVDPTAKAAGATPITPAPLPPTAPPAAAPTLAAPTIPETIVGSETTVIALLGTDESRRAKIWRTDSIVLVLIDEHSQRVGMLSIPRDLWVFVPGHGHARINTVDALGERTGHPGGGLGLFDETLRHNLAIPVDHYVRVDFRGFEDLIDELGGVTIDVRAPIDDRFPDPLHPSGWTRLTLQAGRQHMDGHTALNYCRSRMTTSDFDRSRRQQQVLVALAAKLLTLDSLIRAPKLWEAHSATLDTDLTMVEAVRLAYIVQGIGLENIRNRELGAGTTTGWVTPGGAQVLLPRKGPIQAVVRELLSASG